MQGDTLAILSMLPKSHFSGSSSGRRRGRHQERPVWPTRLGSVACRWRSRRPTAAPSAPSMMANPDENRRRYRDDTEYRICTFKRVREILVLRETWVRSKGRGTSA